MTDSFFFFNSESELLEHSMISSMDTDLIPQDYISHCDALLQSFSARYVQDLYCA